MRLALSLAVLLSVACTGDIFLPGSKGPTPIDPVDPSEVKGAPVIERSTTRRLTRTELKETLVMVFGAGVPVSVDQLPEDTLTPFDNDVQEQSPSMRLVEATEAIGIEVSDWVIADPSRLAAIVPCSTTDAACFEATAQRLARLLLRHPLEPTELGAATEFLGHSTSGGTFSGAVRMLIRYLILHPDFLYRIESGKPGDPSKLQRYELATRLALLLEGRAPDELLLAAAEAGDLDTADGRRAQAERMLSGVQGLAQQRRFVAMWLGYSNLTAPGLETKMRRESDALVDRAFADGADYRTLFSSDETFIDAELGTHYALTGAAASPGWVPYGDAKRRGILSHGSFSIAGAKFGDTSPTRRGKFIRERVFCQKMSLPTVNVDVDQPPKSSDPNACKIDRYAAHRTDAVCAGCHAQMDPIGFGLENLDHLGRWRAHDEGRPECVVKGDGQLDPSTPFNGPKELASLVVASPRIDKCVASQLMRFAAGRGEQVGDDEAAGWLAAQLGANHSVRALLLAYVTHENFTLRRADP